MLHVHSGEQLEQVCHVGVVFFLSRLCSTSCLSSFVLCPWAIRIVPIQLRPCLRRRFCIFNFERGRVLCRFLVAWCSAEFHGLSFAANFPCRVSFQTCLATVVCVLFVLLKEVFVIVSHSGSAWRHDGFVAPCHVVLNNSFLLRSRRSPCCCKVVFPLAPIP